MTRTLVVGGTGALGKSLVRHLLRSEDAHVTVLTPDPNSRRSRQVQELDRDRIYLMSGDLNDASDLMAATEGMNQVFCNTDFDATADVLAEYRQGLNVLEAAKSAGVERCIWSSLDAASMTTGGTNPVPHYDSKAAVAAHVNLLRSDEFMRKVSNAWFSDHVSILTTTPYFESLQNLAPEPASLPDGRKGLMFRLPLGEGRIPLIGLDDVGWIAAYMFEHWQAWGSRDLAVVADSLTGNEIATIFEKVTAIPSFYSPLDLEQFEAVQPDLGHDLAGMFRYFQGRNVLEDDRDLGLVQLLHPKLMTFEKWLRKTNWRGEHQQTLH